MLLRFREIRFASFPKQPATSKNQCLSLIKSNSRPRIENNLRWVKAVILNEDNCHIAKPAAILGIVRDGLNLYGGFWFDN